MAHGLRNEVLAGAVSLEPRRFAQYRQNHYIFSQIITESSSHEHNINTSLSYLLVKGRISCTFLGAITTFTKSDVDETNVATIEREEGRVPWRAIYKFQVTTPGLHQQ